VAFKLESGRHDALDTRHAAFDFEDLSADGAMEMVVMATVGALIRRYSTGNIDQDRVVVFDQILEDTVNRRLAHPRNFQPGKIE